MNSLRIETAMLLLAVGLCARLWFHTALNPISAMVLPFSVALIGEEFLTPRAQFGALGATAILLPAVGFCFGVIVLGPSYQRNPVRRTPRLTIKRPQVALLGVCLIVVVVLIGAYVARSVVRATTIRDLPTHLFDRSLFGDAIRGSRGEIWLRLFNAASLLGAVIVSLYWLARGKFRHVILFFIAVGLYLQNLALAQKLPVFLAILLFIIYFLMTSQRLRFAATRSVILGVLAAVALVAIFSAVAVRRRGVGDRSQLATVAYSLFGSPSALSAVLDGGAVVDERAPHGLAVGGILETMGVLKIPSPYSRNQRLLGQGFDQVEVAPGDSNSLTNIYTGIYYFHRDLGFFGTFLAFIGLGLLAGAMHARFYRRPTVAGLVVLGGMYLLLIAMPISTMSYYNFWWGILLMAPMMAFVYQIHSGERQ